MFDAFYILIFATSYAKHLKVGLSAVRHTELGVLICWYVRRGWDATSRPPKEAHWDAMGANSVQEAPWLVSTAALIAIAAQVAAPVGTTRLRAVAADRVAGRLGWGGNVRDLDMVFLRVDRMMLDGVTG
ncbi:hypothetical protein [Bradyrhizobium sp. LMG 9283]|uniref:hypothetical protein n=1 Tax=Bradyrhizobium sp. LMG 9283 TaxID=592064 RepID=UPI00388D98B7